MPVVDMPLEQLKKYKGTSPCPEDLDIFWDASLSEMYSVEPNIKMIPSDFHVPCADCFDLYYTGVKNARIHAKVLIPKQCSKEMPAVLMFHGYTGNAGNWCEKLSYVSSGFVVAAMDCRGQAGKSEDTGGIMGTTMSGHIIRGIDDAPENMLMRNIFLDTAQLAKIVMNLPMVDKSSVGVMGGSQGGGLSLACASLVPEIRKIATDYPFLCDYRRVWQMDLTFAAYSELRLYFRDFDPLHERENEIFKKLGYIDVQNLVSRIRGDVIMAVGLMDNVCPPSTQFAAYNKIIAPKEVFVYPDFGHEFIPPHADKVYQFMLGLKNN